MNNTANTKGVGLFPHTKQFSSSLQLLVSSDSGPPPCICTSRGRPRWAPATKAKYWSPSSSPGLDTCWLQIQCYCGSSSSCGNSPQDSGTFSDMSGIIEGVINTQTATCRYNSSLLTWAGMPPGSGIPKPCSCSECHCHRGPRRTFHVL